MSEWIIHWLHTAAWREVWLVFLIENLAILALVVVIGNRLVMRYAHRRVAPPPPPLSRGEIVTALANVMLNAAVTVAGLALWRKGVIRFRSDVGIFALLDVVFLLLVMDLFMYALHRLAHLQWLYPILHRPHHRYDNPRPLTLFALSPVENLAFGALWLAVISLYDASWLGMISYLVLNVAFGTLGHLGVEPLPDGWVRHPLLRYIAGATFHAQHHQDREHNFGFYTLVWDRLFKTLRRDYERSFGELAKGAQP